MGTLLRVMNKVLGRIILDRLIRHREEITRDEQAAFRSGRSTIDQVFIVRRVIDPIDSGNWSKTRGRRETSLVRHSRR
ncbi:hypothetical protein RB195_000668 [Necator americanus]|uniref:Reverse transcriptase domain-containing protein n=1 Tax=Necator americanus TaxID=51031 RepID=A0ABR1DBC0_NECAM